jgi:hypothetical protein
MAFGNFLYEHCVLEDKQMSQKDTRIFDSRQATKVVNPIDCRTDHARMETIK